MEKNLFFFLNFILIFIFYFLLFVLFFCCVGFLFSSVYSFCSFFYFIHILLFKDKLYIHVNTNIHHTSFSGGSRFD